MKERFGCAYLKIPPAPCAVAIGSETVRSGLGPPRRASCDRCASNSVRNDRLAAAGPHAANALRRESMRRVAADTSRAASTERAFAGEAVAVPFGRASNPVVTAAATCCGRSGGLRVRGAGSPVARAWRRQPGTEPRAISCAHAGSGWKEWSRRSGHEDDACLTAIRISALAEMSRLRPMIGHRSVERAAARSGSTCMRAARPRGRSAAPPIVCTRRLAACALALFVAARRSGNAGRLSVVAARSGANAVFGEDAS
jgi:hypothetical protein